MSNWPSAHRPSPALIVASLALFVSLGGVGYAAGNAGVDVTAATKGKHKHPPPAAPRLFADVREDATVWSASPGASVSRLAQGNYLVIFPQAVDKCAATANSAHVPISPGVVTGAPATSVLVGLSAPGGTFAGAPVEREVGIQTLDGVGKPVDSAFSLALSC